MKTFSAKPNSVKPKWYTIDASQVPLGDLAVKIANVLRGKDKPTYTPHIDTGDYVVVLNASQIQVSAPKAAKKSFYNYSGYPGGLRERKLSDVIVSNPCEVIERAVKGMMPKNKLAKVQFAKLKVYSGSEHPHTAQKPEILELKQVSQEIK
ncbi:MAG: 50S ribosomal protein L13 [Bifidobacteriaceae bacterium]|jgi:large subunit ribosomal protein L13|nr:50S ribosomal protein L13 [Bifidobacteriaceae bacterium]